MRSVVCPYARLFEPRILSGGPSGLRDRPRPFVLRASHLNGAGMAPGDRFFFDMHVFYSRVPELQSLVDALSELARAGIGRGRGRAVLRRVSDVSTRDTLWQSGGAFKDPAPLVLPLARHAAGCGSVTVRFVTPTELKAGSTIRDRPEFGVLFARIRDRVSALSTFYGSGPLAVDFAGLGERARDVHLIDSDLRPAQIVRRSTRTGQTHGIGGFLGWARYEGELAEFLPYLEVARWTGVGRHTVWGNGVLEISA